MRRGKYYLDFDTTPNPHASQHRIVRFPVVILEVTACVYGGCDGFGRVATQKLSRNRFLSAQTQLPPASSDSRAFPDAATLLIASSLRADRTLGTPSISAAPKPSAKPPVSRSRTLSPTWPTGPKKTAMPCSAS